MLSFSRSPILSYLLWCLVLLALASSNGVVATAKPKVGFGYKLVSLVQLPNGGGLVGYLQVKQRTSTYGPDIPRLRLFVKHETRERVRVQITDADKQRWEVPYNLLPREPAPPVAGGKFTGAPFTAAEYPGEELVFTYGCDPFWFAVHRRSTRQPLFNTSAGALVFKDQYLEVSTALPKDAALYGLGENTQPGGIRLRPNDPYTLYTTDISAINLNTDLYGSHPVYMDLRSLGGRGVAHAVLLLNSNGMDVFYRGTSLTYKVIGGLLDFYFFAGPTPLAIVDQYTSMIGRPAPMPYWAFGFHQCRWGYKNLSVVEGVVEGYRNAQIPLDVIWNDDDHMDAAKDFTLDPVNYPRPKLLAFLDKIHARGMKYIVLIDPGIAVNNSYGVYQRGMARDIFIKLDGQPYLAQVWPGPVYFPDFLNPNGVSWWIDEVRRFHDLVPVDGLWIDMNEASNFCTGKCTIPKKHQCPIPDSKTPWVCCLDCKNLTNTRWDEPPYKINASGQTARLGFNTIATSASHYNGILEYNAHSLYGFSQAIATHKALQGLQGKRPFILTRSTFVGSGAYAAHWTGDNKGTWENLQYSIPTMLNFGIFGMPMVGSDICGFYPSPTEELCNRWIELGAFYPFSRDHANFASPRQELYVWESVAKSARNALGMRYKLLPYLYTLNYQAHLTGAPVARPVFFSFPDFTPCYGLSTQFLLGSSVMVSPSEARKKNRSCSPHSHRRVVLMALSLGAATPTAPPLPRRRVVPFRATASPPALDRRRRPQNVPGEFFVDHRCIDCQTCRWMAPEVFKGVDGKAAVAAQPSSQEDRTKALQALLSCPTSSIHTHKPPKDILQVQNMFPLPLDESLLPGVYLCGYHSEHSFGATSYLVTHPQGNILVDSPRYTPKLADNIERLGGARYMFLTHIDDVADHRKWAQRLKCERIMHSGDVEEGTANVEWKLDGNGPWNIGTDFELIHTPGHTQGSVCLYYKPLKVLFTGDHVAKSEESDDLNLFRMYSKQSVTLQLDSIRKLLEVEFEWILPGHGYRIKYRDVQAKNAAMESLLANYTS